MTHPWQQLQEEVASLFRENGFDAETDLQVQGARSMYSVDVLATRCPRSIEQRVLVECKALNRKVTPDAVSTLLQKVQDSGVNLGILISTKGVARGGMRIINRATSIRAMTIAELRTALRALRDDEAFFGSHLPWLHLGQRETYARFLGGSPDQMSPWPPMRYPRAW